MQIPLFLYLTTFAKTERLAIAQVIAAARRLGHQEPRIAHIEPLLRVAVGQVDITRWSATVRFY